MKVTRSQLRQVLQEEIIKLLERGFGEGTPPDDEIYKKREVYLEQDPKEREYEFTPYQELSLELNKNMSSILKDNIKRKR